MYDSIQKAEPLEASYELGLLWFSRNGVTVHKRLRNPIFGRLTEEQEAAARIYKLRRVAIEADRDIALELHGDDWREHTYFPSFDDLNKKEFERIYAGLL